jgi:hypothetical protein
MNPEPADRLNELLDGDEPPVQEPTFSEPLPPGSAEQLFVSGVLRHLLSADEGHLDRQVGRALATVSMSEQRSHLRRSLTWAVTAAAVVLIVFVITMQRPEDLMATVDRVVDVAQQDVDREFAVRILPDEDAILAEQPQGRLFVHGSSKFAGMIPGPMGDIWWGTDGKEFWFAPEKMPAIRFDDPDLMQRHANRLGVATKAFHLPNLLKQLRRDFDVALTKDSREPKELIDFTAHRRDVIDIWGPEYVRVVANRRTGKLNKLVVTFGPDRPPMAPWVMFVKLVSEEPKPEGFYSVDYKR